MREPTVDELAALDELLADEAAELRPVIRWLAVGPQLAETVFQTVTREPEVAELGRLVRLVQHRAPELFPVAEALVLKSDRSDVILAELQLDRLLAELPDSWSHPVQVLDRPRAPYQALLEACDQRLDTPAETSEEILKSVRDKLARAVRIAATAQRRREQQRIQKEREDRRRRKETEAPESDEGSAGRKGPARS